MLYSLSKREKWLMSQAFRQGYSKGHNDTVESCFNWSCQEGDECLNDWLSDMAADGVTVEMVLAKEVGDDIQSVEVGK